MSRLAATGVRDVLEGNEVSEILRENFFVPPSERANDAQLVSVEVSAPVVGEVARRAQKPKPDHYKVICISMYTEDLDRLDETVRELKRRGYTKANRSAVLRVAMTQLDVDRVPRGL